MAKKPTVEKLAWIVTGNAKAINAMQKSINVRGAELTKHRSILAASCVIHMIEQGNATPMTRFVDSLGSDTRADSVVKWALNTGLFKVAKDKDTKEDVFKKSDDEAFANAVALYEADPAAYTDNLVAKNAWSFDPPKNPFAGMNTVAMTHALLKKARDTMNDSTKAAHPKNDFSIIADLEALLLRYPLKKGNVKAEAAATVTAH